MEESLNKYSKWKWILHSTYILSVYLFINTNRGSSRETSLSFYNKGINAKIYITLTCLSKSKQHSPNDFSTFQSVLFRCSRVGVTDLHTHTFKKTKQ